VVTATELAVRVTGVAAGTRCQLLVTSIRGQDVAADGWTTAAGQLGAWYPASAPFPAASVRGFEVTAGREVVVRVAAVLSGRVKPGTGRRSLCAPVRGGGSLAREPAGTQRPGSESWPG
jgi:hypothetical protein